MKLDRMLLALVLVSPTGCAFVGYNAQNVISDPYNAIQECAFRSRLRLLAKETWRNIEKDGDKRFSPTYVKGFEDGFVDFIDADSPGDIPAAAPNHLRRRLLQSETGHQEIEDWFAGFRHGVDAARTTGLREKYVMPISQPARHPQEPLPAQVVVPLSTNEPAMPAPQVVPMRFTPPAPPATPVVTPAAGALSAPVAAPPPVGGLAAPAAEPAAATRPALAAPVEAPTAATRPALSGPAEVPTPPELDEPISESEL